MWNLQKADIGFGVCLLLCQYVFSLSLSLCSLNGDSWWALIIGSFVWSSWPKRPAVLCVFRQSTLSLYCKFSVWMRERVLMPASVYGICVCVRVCVCEGERKTSRRLSSSVVSQVLTVYICVNILSPVHVRATVNKQKPVLLIKALRCNGLVIYLASSSNG